MTQSRGQNEELDSSFPLELRERYDDVRFLGKGGMGRVYFAIDKRLNRTVAIKLLTLTTDDSELAVRFHQEARAVSKLNNPHVVQVLDFGITDQSEYLFLVMEHIQGEDLSVLLSRVGSLQPKRAIDIARQVCTALEHAHAHGIVHRDLKPSNIMIDSANHVRILDFGLARIREKDGKDGEDRLTRPGQPVGSLMYMSPEQLRGEDSDERSDIYSTALVIYKMIVGSIPNEKETIMKLIRQRLDEAPPEIPPQIDGRSSNLINRLNKVLSIALEHKPANRFANMTEFKNALNDCVREGDSEQQQSQSILLQRKNRKPAWISAIALIVLAGIGLICVSNNQTHPAKEKLRPETTALPEQNPNVPPPGFYQDDGYWSAYDTVSNEGLKRLINTRAKYLNLGNNKLIDKSGMKILSTIPIRVLTLRDTNIGDESIDELNTMALENLNLRHSKVTEAGVRRLHFNLKHQTDLKALDLKYIPLTKAALDHVVKTFPGLQSLNIGETQHLKAADLLVITKLTALNALYMEALDLDDATAEKLVRSDLITDVEFSDTQITDETIKNLMKKPQLKFVSFKSCPKVTDEAIEKLRAHFPGIRIEPRTAAEPPPDLIDTFLKETE